MSKQQKHSKQDEIRDKKRLTVSEVEAIYAADDSLEEDLPSPTFMENDGKPLELPHRYTLFTAYDEYGLKEVETVIEAIERHVV